MKTYNTYSYRFWICMRGLLRVVVLCACRSPDLSARRYCSLKRIDLYHEKQPAPPSSRLILEQTSFAVLTYSSMRFSLHRTGKRSCFFSFFSIDSLSALLLRRLIGFLHYLASCLYWHHISWKSLRFWSAGLFNLVWTVFP